MPKHGGLIAPLHVGMCHESMAEIENADGFTVCTLGGSRLLGQPYPDEVASALTAAYNQVHAREGEGE